MVLAAYRKSRPAAFAIRSGADIATSGFSRSKIPAAFEMRKPSRTRRLHREEDANWQEEPSQRGLPPGGGGPAPARAGRSRPPERARRGGRRRGSPRRSPSRRPRPGRAPRQPRYGRQRRRSPSVAASHRHAAPSTSAAVSTSARPTRPVTASTWIGTTAKSAATVEPRPPREADGEEPRRRGARVVTRVKKRRSRRGSPSGRFP